MMKKRLLVSLIGAVFVLGACTKAEPTASMVSLSEITQNTKMATVKDSQRYAVVIEKSDLSTFARFERGTGCGGYNSELELNAIVMTTIKNALKESFGEIVYLDKELSPAQLKQQGYRGQLSIHEINEDVTYGIFGFFTAQKKATASFNSTILLTSATGKLSKKKVSGFGEAEEPLGFQFCETITEQVEIAVSTGVKELAINIASKALDGFYLMEQQ